MRIFLKSNMVKRDPCSLPKDISSLLILVFLFVSIGSIGASIFLSPALAEAQGSEKGVLHRHHPLVREAIAVKNRHIQSLMETSGVEGAGIGFAQGQPVIKVFTTRPGILGIPKSLDGFPVEAMVTGRIVAMVDPVNPADRFERPVPIGVSTGHPNIGAGTIGCRVTDEVNVYALSNNHVYAEENNAQIGDVVLQPGLSDGGVVGTDPNIIDGDEIGTLIDFEPIQFCRFLCLPFARWCPQNTIDAAIAWSRTDLLGTSTPEDGYGIPKSAIVPPSLGQEVMKYGRTTRLTEGTITAIDVEIYVGYSSCIARFVNQIIVESPTPVILAGDSGSLLVSNPDLNPVGLLFAGNETGTVAIANQIGLVLEAFGVRVDDGTPTPNQPPKADFSYTIDYIDNLTVTFTDESTDPDGSIITRNWNFGDGSTSTEQNPIHTYTNSGKYFVTLTVTDNEGATDTTTQEVAVGEEPKTHVGDLEGSSRRVLKWWWMAMVTISVHDRNCNPVSNAIVSGYWDAGSLYSGSCTTGSNGQCSITSGRIINSSVTFKVTDVIHPPMTYDLIANHDEDGDSNGTRITINR